jgi:hypothetical protein
MPESLPALSVSSKMASASIVNWIQLACWIIRHSSRQAVGQFQLLKADADGAYPQGSLGY